MNWVALLLIVAAAVIGMVNFDPELHEVEGDISALSEPIRKWASRGTVHRVLGQEVFVVEVPAKLPADAKYPTYAFTHGFPTSSFDYADLVDKLSETGRVVIHDHVGFGLSSKPVSNFTFSIFEHADVATSLWCSLHLENIVLIGQDMGSSVATELVTRQERRLLPFCLQDKIKKVVFTNGGMRYSLINFRLSQRALTSPIGPFFNWLSSTLDSASQFSRQQLSSIWSPTYANNEKKESDINHMIELLQYRGGNNIAFKLIRYLFDRREYEYRWFNSLSAIDYPCLILWGDSDAVGPKEIAYAVQQLAPNCKLQFLNGVGHFLMLEAPEEWLSHIVAFAA